MEIQQDSKESMAHAYGKLGTFFLILGRLDEAEEMFQRCLKLEDCPISGADLISAL